MTLTRVDLPAPFSPEQRVDFGREKIEVDAVVGEKIAVTLAYGNGTEQRRWSGGTDL